MKRAVSHFVKVAAAIADLCAASALAQTSIPKERPAARPPSALLGWADWEKGDEMLKRRNAPPALKPAASGELLLPGSKATVFAQKLAYRPTLDVLAPWTVADDIAEWHVDAPAAGTCEITVTPAANANSAGDFYVIETEGSRTRGEVPDNGGYDTFKDQPAGRLTLRSGLNRIILHPDGPLKQELADVRGLHLVPVTKPHDH